MSTEIGIGVSTKLDSFVAGKEAAKNSLHKLGGSEPDIIFLFISPIFDQGLVMKGIYSVIKDVPAVGCSTTGSITCLGSFRASVTVCAITSADIKFSCGMAKNLTKNPRTAGREAAKQSSGKKNPKRQIYIMFSDCLAGNIEAVLRGAHEEFGTGFPIIGGSGADDLVFQKSCQYYDYSIYTDSVVGVLFGGALNIGAGKSHGWQPVGKPHLITKARSNVINEIDGRKAIELYEEYLGKTSMELRKEGFAKLGSSYPMGIRLRTGTEYITRSPIQMTDDGDLIFNAEMPEREEINLMIGDKTVAMGAAKKACSEAMKNIKKSDIKFALVFSDVARLQLLRKESQKELEAIKECLGKDVPFFGCYTCGEYIFSRQEGYGNTYYLQNQLISITVFS